MGYYFTNLDYSGNYYDCKHCGKRVWRESDKQWVKSFCVDSNRTVHLQKAVGGSAMVSSCKIKGPH